MGDPQQMRGSLDRLGFASHPAQKIAAHLIIQSINLVIVLPNKLGSFRVPAHPGPQR